MIQIISFKDLEKAVDKYGEVVVYKDNNDNIVAISMEEYKRNNIKDENNYLLETLYIETVPELKKKILDGMNEPLENCQDADKINF